MLPEDNNQQAAATENEASATQATEGSGEQVESIDDILNGIEAQENTEQVDQTPVETPENTANSPDVAAMQARLDKLEATARDERASTALTETITSMQGSHESLKNVRPAVLEAMLEAEARRDPRILAAYQNAVSDPKTWERVRGGLAEKFAGDFPTSQLASDREAVSAAVRGSANQPPEQTPKIPDQATMSQMSDAEFNAMAKKLEKENAAA